MGVAISSRPTEGQLCVGGTPPWFSLGFFSLPKAQVCQKKKASAAQHPSVVDQYLANEVSLGRVAGPFSAPPFPNLGLFLNEASLGSGASSWTLPPRGGGGGGGG